MFTNSHLGHYPGDGAIADFINISGTNLTCIELDPKLWRVLAQEYAHLANHPRHPVTVILGDFLKHSGLYDRIVMNPPSIFLSEIDHIMHAWDCLKPEGRIVSVASASVTFHRAKKAKEFREFVAQHGSIEPFLPGSFRESGTMENTVMVVLDKP